MPRHRKRIPHRRSTAGGLGLSSRHRGWLLAKARRPIRRPRPAPGAVVLSARTARKPVVPTPEPKVRMTHRWREQDSNSRSRRERNGRWEARHISFRAQLYELGARQSRERPKSSNPSPPAGSPVRTWLFGAKPINSRRANRVATARPSRSLGARRGHRSLSVEPLARCTAAVPFSIQRAPSAAQPTRKLGARGASTCGSRVSP